MPLPLSSLAGDSAPLSASNPVVNIQSQRLKQCIQTFARWMHFPDDMEIVYTLLGAVAANYLPDERPVWLMIVAPSGGGKTELCETLRWSADMRYVGELSEPGLLSWRQADGKPIACGVMADIGKFGIIVIPEFSGILAANHHKQQPILVGLRRVYDGFLSREIKNDAGEPLEWYGKCGMIAASAPGIDSQRHTIAVMGERFLYYRIQYAPEDRKKVGQLTGRNGGKYKQMRMEQAVAVKSVLMPVIDNPPQLELTDEEIHWLGVLGEFGKRARSVVERNTSWAQDAEARHDQELGSGRLAAELRALFIGLLVIGCDYTRARRIVYNAAWHSIPYARALVLRAFLETTDPGTTGYTSGLQNIVALLTRRDPDKCGYPERFVQRGLEDLTLSAVLEQKRGGKRGALSAWRVAMPTWELYAELQESPPPDPRHGLLGSLGDTVEAVPGGLRGQNR